MSIPQQLHAIWLDSSIDHMDIIEAEFNKVLTANKLSELPSEFYEDINCVSSNNFKHFKRKYEKWTSDEIEEDDAARDIDWSNSEEVARHCNPSLCGLRKYF